MLLRKSDLDPRVAERLPSDALRVTAPWAVRLVVALGLLNAVTFSFVALNTRVNAATSLFVFVSMASCVAFVWAMVTARRTRKETAQVVPAALRRFGKNGRSFDLVEREYCKTVATLAESAVITEPAARELLGDLNRLLAAHRALMAQELPKKARIAREETAVQTLRQLRASLKRAGKLVMEPVSPAAVAEQTVDETISQVRLQARSLEQATEEVQQLRR